MAEKCKYAYRKNGDVSVHCRLVEGKFDYCAHTYFCSNTSRWEADKLAQCSLRKKRAESLKNKATD